MTYVLIRVIFYIRIHTHHTYIHTSSSHSSYAESASQITNIRYLAHLLLYLGCDHRGLTLSDSLPTFNTETDTNYGEVCSSYCEIYTYITHTYTYITYTYTYITHTYIYHTFLRTCLYMLGLQRTQFYKSWDFF